MKLTVSERLDINELFPPKADILTQTIIKDIIEKTTLSQKETKKINLRPVGKGQPGMIYDTKAVTPKAVTFSTPELELLKSRVDIMDKEKKVGRNILELCLKIRDEKPPEKKG